MMSFGNLLDKTDVDPVSNLNDNFVGQNIR